MQAPKDWQSKLLEDVTHKIGDGLHGTPRYVLDSEIYFVNGNNLYDGAVTISSDTKKVSNEEFDKHKKDLIETTLLLSINGTVGNVAKYNGERIILGKSAAYLNCNEKIVLRDYVYYYLHLPETVSHFNKEVTGSTIKNLSLKTIRETPIYFPQLPEQKKIATILSTWDKAIDAQTKLITAKEKQRQEIVTSILKSHESNWDTTSLKEVADKSKRWSFTGGPFGSNLKADDYTESGIRIIQLQNIGDGEFRNDYKIYTSEEKADELLSCNIYPGEIIISKMGDPVARACFIPNGDERYVMASDGIRLAVDETKFDPYFILTSINDGAFRKKAFELAIGSTRKRIGLDDLKTIEFLVPGLDQQRLIAQLIRALDNEVRLMKEELQLVRQQKKGLMQNLLTGKIRVKA